MLPIEYARQTSHAGRLLNCILERQFDVKNFSVDWADVTAEEVTGLRILEQEQQKHLNERQEEMHEKMMQERIKNQQRLNPQR